MNCRFLIFTSRNAALKVSASWSVRLTDLLMYSTILFSLVINSVSSLKGAEIAQQATHKYTKVFASRCFCICFQFVDVKPVTCRKRQVPDIAKPNVVGSYFLSFKYSSAKCCLCFGLANLSALYSLVVPFGIEREAHFSLHNSFPINTICPMW